MLRYATESNKKVLHCCRTFVMKYFLESKSSYFTTST